MNATCYLYTQETLTELLLFYSWIALHIKTNRQRTWARFGIRQLKFISIEITKKFFTEHLMR